MIDWRDPDGRPRFDITVGTAARWGLAALAVVAVHAGGTWAALRWPQREAAPGEPPAPVMIELAPLAVAPEAPPLDVAPGPEMSQAEPRPAPEPMADEPDPKVAEIEEPTPRERELDVKLPDLPPIPNAASVLSAPPPKPRVERKRRPEERIRKVERKPPAKPEQRSGRQTTAPPTARVQQSSRAAAPAAGAPQSPSISPSTWRGSLMAHLNRHKRYPAGASSGTAQIVFTIDRAGRVLSARLIGSSGDASLDTEAASLPRRASPVPAPPPGTGGATLALTVPIRFHR